MFYRGPNDRITRALRRLFVVKCYKGNPDAKKPKYENVKVIAWNACDASRRVARPVAEIPEPECWVTWDDIPLKIHSAKLGPTDEKADPDVGAVTEENFKS